MLLVGYIKSGNKAAIIDTPHASILATAKPFEALSKNLDNIIHITRPDLLYLQVSIFALLFKIFIYFQRMPEQN